MTSEIHSCCGIILALRSSINQVESTVEIQGRIIFSYLYHTLAYLYLVPSFLLANNVRNSIYIIQMAQFKKKSCHLPRQWERRNVYK
jgi:hypothetical protein